jgi:hypothetical protein
MTRRDFVVGLFAHGHNSEHTSTTESQGSLIGGGGSCSADR